jgi:hypothetical protein
MKFNHCLTKYESALLTFFYFILELQVHPDLRCSYFPGKQPVTRKHVSLCNVYMDSFL